MLRRASISYLELEKISNLRSTQTGEAGHAANLGGNSIDLVAIEIKHISSRVCESDNAKSCSAAKFCCTSQEQQCGKNCDHVLGSWSSHSTRNRAVSVGLMSCLFVCSICTRFREIISNLPNLTSLQAVSEKSSIAR